MIRSILATIIGIFAGSVFNMAIIMLSWKIFPFPEGGNMSDPETFKAYVKALPVTALLIVLVAHAGGAFIGGAVAGRITKYSPRVIGAVVGGFFMLGGIINLLSIPCPVWFAVADMISYLPSGIFGAKLASQRQSK